jgi:hypothetical protein
VARVVKQAVVSPPSASTLPDSPEATTHPAGFPPRPPQRAGAPTEEPLGSKNTSSTAASPTASNRTFKASLKLLVRSARASVMQ